MLLIARIDAWHYLFALPLFVLSLFLVLVILVQRGRGGGLTGALGGMGGQSAFGTKAGDLFTRITIIVAAIWILLSMAALKTLNRRSATAGLRPGARAPAVPAKGKTAPGKMEETPDQSPANSSEESSDSPPATKAENLSPPAGPESASSENAGQKGAQPAEAPRQP